jgi:hypothetical protein
MNSQICQAIREMRVIEFYYDGGVRTVEPFCHGVSTAGNEVLRGCQVGGYSRSGDLPRWRLFNVAEIRRLTVTEEAFTGKRPGYRARDSAMGRVCCHV